MVLRMALFYFFMLYLVQTSVLYGYIQVAPEAGVNFQLGSAFPESKECPLNDVPAHLFISGVKQGEVAQGHEVGFIHTLKRFVLT